MDQMKHLLSFAAGAISIASAFYVCKCCSDDCGPCRIPPGCVGQQCHQDLKARVEKLERARIGAAGAEQP